MTGRRRGRHLRHANGDRAGTCASACMRSGVAMHVMPLATRHCSTAAGTRPMGQHTATPCAGRRAPQRGNRRDTHRRAVRRSRGVSGRGRKTRALTARKRSLHKCALRRGWTCGAGGDGSMAVAAWAWVWRAYSRTRHGQVRCSRRGAQYCRVDCHRAGTQAVDSLRPRRVMLRINLNPIRIFCLVRLITLTRIPKRSQTRIPDFPGLRFSRERSYNRLSTAAWLQSRFRATGSRQSAVNN